MKLVVVGTGRSGTQYVSKVLNESGLRCGHETVFGPWGRLIEHTLEADASWLALAHIDFIHDPILLVYRQPEKVIGSFVKIGFFDLEPDEAHLPYIKVMKEIAPDVFDSDDPIIRAANWYCAANMIALSKADAVEPLEDIRWSRVNDLAGGNLDWATAVMNVPQNANSRGPSVEITELPQQVHDVYALLNKAASKGIS